jgi:hypothetical protein
LHAQSMGGERDGVVKPCRVPLHAQSVGGERDGVVKPCRVPLHAQSMGGERDGVRGVDCCSIACLEVRAACAHGCVQRRSPIEIVPQGHTALAGINDVASMLCRSCDASSGGVQPF